MASLYKGEYLDVSTLYIGQKIEEGFKLIRDQMSASDPTNALVELAVVLKAAKSERAVSWSSVYNVLDTVCSRLANTNRHLTNLEFLAPPKEKVDKKESE